LQERDYKNGRVWQEDDHTTRTFSSASRSPKPERKQSGKTSNREKGEQEEQIENDVESLKLPPVPKLREDSDALPPQYSQQGTLPQGLLQGHRGVPQGRGGDVPVNEYSQYHPSAGMIPSSYYQANLPSTPVRNRERQISDISSVAGSVGGPVPVVYPDGTYGLIYPPTPGGSTVGYELAQNPGLYQYDPRQLQQQGVMPWMNPHLYPIPTQASNRVANEDISRVKESETVSNDAAAPSNDHAPVSSNARTSLRSSRPRSNPSRSVSFSNLEIRTYETILGDNPSCSGGPSLSIGWRYDPNHDSLSIDDYEAHQARINGLPPGSTYACRPEELVLHRSEREEILLSSGYTRQDFVESIRSMKKIKSKRRQTVNNLPVMYFEERVESANRTLRRFFKRTQRTRHIYEDWKEKSVQGR